MPVNAAIIGCGMIAGGYDTQAPDDSPRTHAGALVHRGARIVACVEPDTERRKAFQARWSIGRGYARIEDMLAEHGDLDIACVATPDERHAADLDVLLTVPVKTVFCEKPLAADIADARRLVGAYRAAKRPLAINYTRRWNPAFGSLAGDISKGCLGALLGVTGWYGKGIVHNGSHMLDLLRMLIGELRPVRAERLVDDGRTNDPTLDALLLASNGAPVQLIGTDHRHYDMFELQMRFERAVATLEDGGASLRLRFVENNPNFVGHRKPGREERHDTRSIDAMLLAMDNVIANAKSGQPLVSDGASALAGQEIAAKLLVMAQPPGKA